MWHLFSGVPEAVQFGLEYYRPHGEISTALNQLFENYQIEGFNMPYTMEDLEREVARKHVKDLTVEERIEGLSADELLERVPADEAMQHFSPDQRLAGLSSDELLQRLSPEQIRDYLKRLEEQENGHSDGNGES